MVRWRPLMGRDSVGVGEYLFAIEGTIDGS
jgi:hypothetical protein